MCQGCYEEYGSPTVVTDSVREAAELVADVYEFSAVGGNAHIVLDDWNLEDDYIRWCLEKAIPENAHEAEPGQIEAEQKCLTAFLALSLEDRAAALALSEGRIEGVIDGNDA